MISTRTKALQNSLLYVMCPVVSAGLLGKGVCCTGTKVSLTKAVVPECRVVVVGLRKKPVFRVCLLVAKTHKNQPILFPQLMALRKCSPCVFLCVLLSLFL